MAKIIGVDLGTTNSTVAVWQDGAPHIIPDAEGHILTPSVVALDDHGQWLVGRAAQAVAEHVPEHVVKSIKRLMGRRFDDKVIQDTLHKGCLLCNVIEAKHRREGIEVELERNHLTPQEISAKILQKLKADAEAYLGHAVKQAVVTVPAYFHDTQRQATRDAGRIAGLEVLRVLNEPTAACLAFGYKKLAEARKKIAVYDLGGGTFDISILEVGRGPFRVRATNGDTYLGGDDLDMQLVDWLLSQMEHADQQQVRDDSVALARLHRVAEQAKVTLSSLEETQISIEEPIAALANISGLTITRATLEQIAEGFIEQTLVPCRQALQDAKLRTADLEEVVLVGGQTRMPLIRQAVQDFFERVPDTSVNPEEIVAVGAAVRAAMLAGEATGIRLADVVPLSLGVATKGRMDTLISRNSSVPIARTRPYTTADDNQVSVDIQIYQGECPMVDDNVKLGSFTLQGIEPARAGEPEIEVTFRVEEDGILHVTATDLRAEHSKKEITITDSVKLSEEEIEAMIRDAEKHASEYAAQRRQAEAQEQCESLSRRLEQLFAEKAGELPEDLAGEVREVLQLPEPEDWVARQERLQVLWRRVGERGTGVSE